MATETTDLTKIRLAETPPTHCSSCFQQAPENRHVDFNAAWDGPTFPDEEVAGGGVVAIDDLILCEDCVRTAGDVIGLADPGDLKLHVESAEEANEELREKLSGALAYINKLEAAQRERKALEEFMAGRRTAEGGDR